MDFYKQTEAIDITRLLGFLHAEQKRTDDTLTVLKSVADATGANMGSEMMQQVVDAYADGQKAFMRGRTLAQLIDIYQNTRNGSVSAIFRSKNFYWTAVHRAAASAIDCEKVARPSSSS